MNYIIPVALLAVFTIGCKKKDDAAETKESPAEVAPAKVVDDMPKPPVAEDHAAAEVEPPTAADFEGEAIETITDETLEKDLSAIEKDLGD